MNVLQNVNNFWGSARASHRSLFPFVAVLQGAVCLALPFGRPFHACYQAQLLVRQRFHLKGQRSNDTLLNLQMRFWMENPFRLSVALLPFRPRRIAQGTSSHSLCNRPTVVAPPKKNSLLSRATWLVGLCVIKSCGWNYLKPRAYLCPSAQGWFKPCDSDKWRLLSEKWVFWTLWLCLVNEHHDCL